MNFVVFLHALDRRRYSEIDQNGLRRRAMNGRRLRYYVDEIGGKQKCCQDWRYVRCHNAAPQENFDSSKICRRLRR
uniref:Uncharacterized protein n=1 Tax=Romanomermis culicivorax TaxID=13658 RepID=A0A915HNV4_ROMCU